jgi:hypothetical protein
MSRVLCVLMLLGIATTPCRAVLTYSGTELTQNFNSLATSGTTNAWSNDTSPLSGWSLFRRTSSSNTTPVAVTNYLASTGSGTEGGFYSFGPSGNSDRALGGIGSANATAWGSAPQGQVAGWMAVAIQNGTGGVLNEFTVAFDGEQWRRENNATAHTMVMEYGFGATFDVVSTWTAPGGNFDWTGPVTGTTTGAAIDGNSTGSVTGRGGTIGSLTWANSQILWIRWIENNDAGNDHGLAIDNFSFSAAAVAAVPEVSAFFFGSLICCALGLWSLRRRLVEEAVI